MERRKGRDEKELCRPEVIADSNRIQTLMKDLADAGAELEAATGRWEELMEIIEKIEKGE